DRNVTGVQTCALPILDDFYGGFHKRLEVAEEEMEKIEVKDESAGITCEKCGHEMVYKMGRYGKFLACSNFPECRNTKPILKKIEIGRASSRERVKKRW